MTRVGREATDWAKAHGQQGVWRRQCLKFVRMSFGLAGGTANAGLAWDNARFKHRTNDGETIPPFVPVFWETSGVADHIAISVGGGNCRSTDVRVAGNADIVSINALTRKWGMDLQGWTEDLNGVRIHFPSKSRPKPPVKQRPRTPNITEAMRRNIQYRGSLEDITDPEARKIANIAIKRLKEEYAALSSQELR